MAVTRLSGGLTPGVGSDPRTFPAIFNAAADVIDANELAVLSQGSAIASQGSAIDAIEAWDLDNLNDVVIGTAVAGQKLVFDGTNWVNLTGYVYVQAVYFTSSGTFSKGDYPWLRAIRVRCQAGGGGGGGSLAQGAGKGGGGGAYAEAFITDIAGLAASVTVTRGAGGAGGAAGNNNGSTGGQSAFGAITADGGSGGFGGAAAAAFPNFGAVSGGVGSNTTANADFSVSGSSSSVGSVLRATTVGNGGVVGSNGASCFLGAGGRATAAAIGGSAGVRGGGGGGGFAGTGDASIAGLAGGDGIVIVELYA
jgi:hypothetical protein